jgi:hypothetical protein
MGGFVTINSAMMSKLLSTSATPTSKSGTQASSISSSFKSSNPMKISAPAAHVDDSSFLLGDNNNCKIWYRLSKPILSLEECVYMISRTHSYPMAYICEDDEQCESVSELLRLLCGHPTTVCVVNVCMKSQRVQTQKNMKVFASNTSKQANGIIVINKHMVTFADSCLPSNYRLQTVVHIGMIGKQEYYKRLELVHRQASMHTDANVFNNDDCEQIIIAEDANTDLAVKKQPGSSDTKIYVFRKQWMSAVQARVSATKKLMVALKQGAELTSGIYGTHNEDTEQSLDEKRKGLASRIAALRTKIKVLLSAKLPDCKHEQLTIAPVEEIPNGKLNGSIGDAAKSKHGSIDLASEFNRIIAKYTHLPRSQNASSSSSSSAKLLRQKMLVLGMLDDACVPGAASSAVHGQAETGRSLAVTK